MLSAICKLQSRFQGALKVNKSDGYHERKCYSKNPEKEVHFDCADTVSNCTALNRLQQHISTGYDYQLPSCLASHLIFNSLNSNMFSLKQNHVRRCFFLEI